MLGPFELDNKISLLMIVSATFKKEVFIVILSPNAHFGRIQKYKCLYRLIVFVLILFSKAFGTLITIL